MASLLLFLSLTMSSCVWDRDGTVFAGVLVDLNGKATLLKKQVCEPVRPPVPRGFCIGQPTTVRYDGSK